MSEERDPDLERWLEDAAAPRPLDDLMAERWVEGMVAPGGLPRPIRARLVASMVATDRGVLPRVLAAVAAATLLLGLVTAISRTDRAPVASPDFRLIAFDGCDELVTQLRVQAREQRDELDARFPATPEEIRPGSIVTDDLPDAAQVGDVVDVPMTPSAPAAMAAAPASPFTGTNVQEREVDESDQVKALGDRLFDIRSVDDVIEEDSFHRVYREAVLRELAVSDSAIQVVAELSLPWGEELLVLDGRLWVLGDDRDRTRAALIDTEGSALAVAWEYSVDGRYVSSRVVGGRVQLVVAGDLRRGGLDPDGLLSRDDLERWEDAVETSVAADWLPREEVRAAGRVVASGPAVGCERLLKPADRADLGFSATLVIALPQNERGEADSTGAVGAGGVVYASPTSVYVARGGARSPESVIHRFAVEDGRPRYAGSGAVDGAVYGPLAMSEHGGVLRVASTLDHPVRLMPTPEPASPGDPAAPDLPPRGPGTSASPASPDGVSRSEADGTDNIVTTLSLREGLLPVLGRLGGLGKPNESITAARFDGPTAYLSTAIGFRDPLYIVDLADPAQPRLMGALDVPGLPLYLHRISESTLASVSRYVIPGRNPYDNVTAVRVAVFDVSDPELPRQVSALDVEGRALESVDHHQYLFLPDREVLAVAGSPAIAFDLADGEVAERWRIAHSRRPLKGGYVSPNWSPAIQRIVARGDRVVTISTAGALLSDLATGREVAFASYWAG